MYVAGQSLPTYNVLISDVHEQSLVITLHNDFNHDFANLDDGCMPSVKVQGISSFCDSSLCDF